MTPAVPPSIGADTLHVLRPRWNAQHPRPFVKEKNLTYNPEDVRVSSGVLLWPACDSNELCDRRSRRRVSVRPSGFWERRAAVRSLGCRARARALARDREADTVHARPEGGR